MQKNLKFFETVRYGETEKQNIYGTHKINR